MSIEKHAFNLSLFLGTKKYELSFIKIEFEFASRHPFLDILKTSV